VIGRKALNMVGVEDGDDQQVEVDVGQLHGVSRKRLKWEALYVICRVFISFSEHCRIREMLSAG
jgi:hypothetical protein